MQENETAAEGESSASTATEGTEQETATQATEEISYHAVEKDGQVTAIWEMQGRKHLRTIDPRSRQGQDILRLYTADQQEGASEPETGETAST
ncbi:MAG TPA: hypothetical protein VF779_00460 [Pyrinomonadaceae bacterium]